MLLVLSLELIKFRLKLFCISMAFLNICKAGDMYHSQELYDESQDRGNDHNEATIGSPATVVLDFTYAFFHSLIQVNHFSKLKLLK